MRIRINFPVNEVTVLFPLKLRAALSSRDKILIELEALR